MIEICEPRLRAVSQSVERHARDTKMTRAWWKARDGRGARTWTPFTKPEEKERLLTVYEQIVEGFNAVNCQPSNDLKFNHQPTKKGYFNRQPSKMQINLNYQKGFKVQLFQILLFQLIFTADLIITNLLIYTEGNIYLNARTKFLLNNRVNRQELPPR